MTNIPFSSYPFHPLIPPATSIPIHSPPAPAPPIPCARRPSSCVAALRRRSSSGLPTSLAPLPRHSPPCACLVPHHPLLRCPGRPPPTSPSGASPLLGRFGCSGPPAFLAPSPRHSSPCAVPRRAPPSSFSALSHHSPAGHPESEPRRRPWRQPAELLRQPWPAPTSCCCSLPWPATRRGHGWQRPRGAGGAAGEAAIFRCVPAFWL
jgi:hypothetical protein